MSSAPLSATELAGMIDHTLLTPEATHNDVAKLVADAKKYGTCIWPSCAGFRQASTPAQ